jgi:hypothetical protein
MLKKGDRGDNDFDDIGKEFKNFDKILNNDEDNAYKDEMKFLSSKRAMNSTMGKFMRDGDKRERDGNNSRGGSRGRGRGGFRGSSRGNSRGRGSSRGGKNKFNNKNKF